MNKEQEKTIDRFGLVQAYQKASSKEDFLYMLMNLEAVQAQSGMMAYIRQMLQTMREYARHRAFALAKGIVTSIFQGKAKEAAKEYDRFEETPEFAQQMDGLWRALGIDYDAYSDREVIRQHNELSDALKSQGYEKEALRRMEYDAKAHIFSLPEITDTVERKEEPVGWRSFAVLSKAEYERLLIYVEDKETERPEARGELQLKASDMGLTTFEEMKAEKQSLAEEFETIMESRTTKAERINYLTRLLETHKDMPYQEINAEYWKLKKAEEKNAGKGGFLGFAKKSVAQEYKMQHRSELNTYKFHRDILRSMIEEDDKKINPRAWQKELDTLTKEYDETKKPYAQLVWRLASIEVLSHNRRDLERMLENESHQQNRDISRSRNNQSL